MQWYALFEKRIYPRENILIEIPRQAPIRYYKIFHNLYHRNNVA